MKRKEQRNGVRRYLLTAAAAAFCLSWGITAMGAPGSGEHLTAGVGENSPVIRDRILKHLAYMNITIDETENHRRGEEVVISAPGPGPKVLVIPTNEELSIARQTYAIVAK